MNIEEKTVDTQATKPEENENENVDNESRQRTDDEMRKRDVDNEPRKRDNVDNEPRFTQSQVNELVGKVRQEARESALKQMLERYGVESEDDLNEMFGAGQKYGMLDEDYRGLNSKYSDVMTENALLKSQIVPDRWEDVKAILTTKGLGVTPENIAIEIATHPEWLPQVENEIPPVAVTRLGDNEIEKREPENEREEILRLMGVL